MELDSLLNSPFVNKLLRFGLSKTGGFVNVVAAQIAAHIIVWFGLSNFLDHDTLEQIRGGLEQGAIYFGTALTTIVYAWLVDRQKRGVKAIQAAVNMSVATPAAQNTFVDQHGIAGNNTVAAIANALSVSPAAAVKHADLPGNN